MEAGASCSLETPDPDFADLCLYSGAIDSSRRACIANRKVKIFAFVKPGPEAVLVDTAVTSRRGGFAGLGRSSDVSAFRARVLQKKVGPKNRRITCEKAQFTGA